MKIQIFACLLTLAIFAQEPPPITKLQNGAFIGLGGSYNSAKIEQQLNGTEFSSIFSGSSLVALGESGGLAPPYDTTQSTLAPQLQFGYLHRFSNNRWFLGCKAVYQYLNLAFTKNNLESFPRAMYTVVGEEADAWIGRFSIGSSQTHVNHELFFLPMFGYFFNNSSAYLGAGPVVFETACKLYDVRGSSSLNGTVSEITGAPANLSLSKSMWGVIAQLGLIYPLASDWFLDFNYSYAETANYSAKDSVLFSNSLISGTIYGEEGIAFVNSKLRVCVQSFTVTMNKAF